MAVGVAAEVKNKLSVVDVVGETVQLKKAGTTYKGLCPFHGEKTPSFTVTPARDSWKCFGCGEGGDIFSFVMKRDSLSFPEALKVLAAKAGVELDERTTREDARKKRLRDVLESAIAFYHAVLTGSKTGAAGARLPPRPRLHRRDDREVPARLRAGRLGHARRGSSPRKRNVRADELVEVGLAQPRQSGRGGVYDRFRERVIFPIRDANGVAGRARRADPRVAADDGGDHGPKYLNSPATPLFDKSRTLYLIDKAKGPIRKCGQAVIVEGYTDALMAHQAGFDNVVASLGTALTPGPGRRCSPATRRRSRSPTTSTRPARRPGRSGRQALESLIGQLAAADTGVELDEVRVVRLPDGKDPDEVVRETPDRWREEVRTAQPIVDYLIDFHARQVDLKTPGGKARFVDAIVPTLRAIPNPVMRDAYLQTIHRVSGVEERSVLEVLHRRPAPRRHVAGPDHRRRRPRLGRRAAGRPDPRARSRRSRRSCSGCCCSPRTSSSARPTRSAPTSCPRRRPASCSGRSSCSAPPNDQGIRPPFSMSALMAGLDDETRATAQAILAKPSPDLALVASERIAYAVDRCLLQLERLRARRAGRLGRRRAPRRRGPRRPRDRRPARRPSSARTTKPVGRWIARSNKPPCWSAHDTEPARPSTRRH